MYLKLIIKKLAKIVCIVLTVFMAHAALAAPNMIAGYYRELSIYLRSYFPADIPVEKLTHVIHAFIDVTGNGDAYSCTAVDPFALYEKVDYRFPDYGKGIINQMKYLRDKSGRNNDLKLIFSIGGQVRSAQFASATSSSLRRANFAHSCVSFMRQHGYDGLDFDWEFQETREQGVNYKALLDEVRRQMDEAESIDRKQYQLGVTVGVHPDAYNTLPLENFADSVDWVGIMSYNYTLPTRDQTGHNAPLYASSKNLIPFGESIVDSIASYNSAGNGVPLSKLVIGVPYYGIGWTGVTAGSSNGLYQYAAGPAPSRYESGYFDYSDLHSNYVGTHGWVRSVDSESQVPSLFNEQSRTFISYDDAESLQKKIRYIKTKGLKGVMAWELSGDNAHLLTSAMYSELHATSQHIPAPVVKPSVVYSGSFVETAANDGTITGSIVISLSGDTFIKNPIAGTHYSFDHVPRGLIPIITRDSDTQLTLTFTGKAVIHHNLNDKVDLSVFLKDGIFGNYPKASDVSGYQLLLGRIDFNDPGFVFPVPGSSAVTVPAPLIASTSGGGGAGAGVTSPELVISPAGIQHNSESKQLTKSEKALERRILSKGFVPKRDSRFCPTTVLTKGSKGTKVAVMQNFLKGRGYPIGRKGTFGAITKKSLMSFQKTQAKKTAESPATVTVNGVWEGATIQQALKLGLCK